MQDSTILKFPSGNKCNLRLCLMGFWWTCYRTKLLTLNQPCTPKALHHFKGEDHCCRHRGKPHWRRKVFPVQTPKHTFHHEWCQWLMWRSTGLNLSKNLNVCNINGPAQKNWTLVFFFVSLLETDSLWRWTCFCWYVIYEAFMIWIAAVGLLRFVIESDWISLWWILNVVSMIVWLYYKLNRVINFNALHVLALLQMCLLFEWFGQFSSLALQFSIDFTFR